jgi:hypothetical protein
MGRSEEKGTAEKDEGAERGGRGNTCMARIGLMGKKRRKRFNGRRMPKGKEDRSNTCLALSRSAASSGCDADRKYKFAAGIGRLSEKW